ncbi:E3 ubiquitin-protein ligase RNF170-like isoform X3 [Tubulanus polymorphus]|uniref:E3 ubiquitin-protein ligase RNF170-like isoform X3 n=1 Tax=Tubulanus polymorphus TaxID=672921 RepID=UPI003DA1D4E1
MLVEGIADDLLMGTLVFVFGLAVVLMILIKRQHYVQRIHPESQDNVNFTRQLITQQPNSSESRIRSEEITCPICLGDAIYAVETNCSHIFCGNCILAYWHHGSWIGAMRCPVCRQQVSLLLMDFNAEEVSRNNCDSRRLIIEGIHTYNRRFSGEPRKFVLLMLLQDSREVHMIATYSDLQVYVDG